VQLTWTPRASRDNLAIYKGTSKDIRQAVSAGAATGTSATVTDLDKGTTYYFWLVDGKPPNAVSNMALARTARSPAEIPAEIPAGTPGTPGGLTATAGNAQVALKWDAPAKGVGSPVIRYNVYKGTTADFTATDPAATVKDTSVVLGDLVNGTTYYFRVNAVSKFQGPASCEVPATPAPEAPGAPTGLTATTGNGQVTLNWDPPASNGGSDVTSYKVYVGTTAGFTRGDPFTSTPGTTATVPQLTNGTTYYFQVTAVNQVGEGQPSEVPATPAPEAPGAPTGLTATRGNGQVTLNWDPPASNGGSDVTSYKVYVGTTAGFTRGDPFTSTPGTTATVPQLTNGTTYYFQVTAVNAVGEGQASEVPATPAPEAPGAPTGLTATRGNGQVTLNWDPPASNGGSDVTRYNIYAGTTANLTGSAPVGSVTGTVVIVRGLTRGTTYYFQVTAVNAVGEGSPSEEVPAVAVTVPEAPTGLTVTPGKSQMTLKWTPPASDGGLPVTGYVIYQGTSPGVGTGAPGGGLLVRTTSYTVTGLTNGTTYYFGVAAVNAVGEGSQSEEVSAVLPPPPTQTPTQTGTPTETPTQTGTPTETPTQTGTPTETPTQTGTPTPTGTPGPSASSSAPTFAAPTGLAAKPDNSQVRLSWTALAPGGGSSVIGYKVYFATVPGVQNSAALGTTKDTDAIVAGLTNGKKYWFTVTAVNGAGHESPFSAEVAATPTKLASAPVVNLPSGGLPKQLVALLAAVAAAVVAVAGTMIARRWGRPRPPERGHQAHSDQQADVPTDIRAVPDTSRPDVVGVRETGQEPSHTVRLEPHPGLATTTIKEGQP
jgi:titin